MQDVMWTILELAANILESFFCIHFIINSFDSKFRFWSSKIVHLVGTVSMAAVVTALNCVTVYEGLLGIIYAVFFVIFSMVFMRGTVHKKIFISILANICLISTAAVTGNLLSFIFNDSRMNIYTEHSFERLIYMVVGVALAAYVFAVLSRFTNGNKENLSIKEWTLILSVLAISFFVIAVIHIIILNDEISRGHIYLLMISELCIIFINILCLFITVNLSKTHKREERLTVEKKRSEYSQKYAQTIKEQYEQTRRLRHDMKQYCTVLDSLIVDKKYNEARKLISNYYENISCTEVVIDVGDDFVNSILNAKLTLAKSLGIDVICSSEKDLSGFDSADLCSLLGNLLDNAIEAAQKCEPEKRSVELNISTTNNHMNITVRNSIANSVLKENPKLLTTKPDSVEHGFGIKTIRFITEKYGGTVDFYEENLTFVCGIVMYKIKEILPLS